MVISRLIVLTRCGPLFPELRRGQTEGGNRQATGGEKCLSECSERKSEEGVTRKIRSSEKITRTGKVWSFRHLLTDYEFFSFLHGPIGSVILLSNDLTY